MADKELNVAALATELVKLFAVAALAAITTVSYGTYNLQRPTSLANKPEQVIVVGPDVTREETSETDSFGDVRALLNLIYKYESVGAVNSQGVQSAYDVIYGGIARKDRPRNPLTQMTVAEVLAWQDRIDSRYRSEAAGAPQVMEDTLRGLVDLGLVDPIAVFDNATQDTVAKLLMERRGLSEFMAGEISAEDFADSLAREWASMPVVRDQQGANRYVKRGQSYYAGDGLNKAHAAPDDVLGVLRVLVTAPAKPLEGAMQNGFEAPEQSLQRRQAAEGSAEKGSVKLRATKPVDGSVKIDGQLALTGYRNWNIATNVEYEFETDIYKIGGTATYERDNLSFSFSGSHDSDDNTEFSAEVAIRF